MARAEISIPRKSTLTRRGDAPIRLGFVPLAHAAPLLVARELGFFTRRGLSIKLTREVGWATIREKILNGELDAAQALAPMPLAMSLGLNSARCDCVSALILNLHGDSIVLSGSLWKETGGDPRLLERIRRRRSDLLTFAVVYPHSAQSYVLRQWLQKANLMPDRDYRLAVVPPPQMVAHLRAGHIDGCCVGEPWGSLAVQQGVGVITALSADLAPQHPEKVLLVRSAFAEARPDLHLQLIAALLESCAWCAQPENHAEVVALLSGRDGVGLPLEVLRPAITGNLDLGAGRKAQRPDALIFHGDHANEPTHGAASYIASILGVTAPPTLLGRVFRPDLFHAARRVDGHASRPAASLVLPSTPHLDELQSHVA